GVREHVGAIAEPHAKLRVGEHLLHRSFHLDHLFFSHLPFLSSRVARPRRERAPRGYPKESGKSFIASLPPVALRIRGKKSRRRSRLQAQRLVISYTSFRRRAPWKPGNTLLIRGRAGRVARVPEARDGGDPQWKIRAPSG